MTDVAEATGPEAQYRAYLAEGRFMIQKSRSSGQYVFYPRVAEPGTGARDLEWVAPSGLGRVCATTVTRQRPEKGGDYNIAMVDLDEGPRVLSRVTGMAPDEVTIGLRVEAYVDELDGAPAVLFRKVEGAQ
ncbi:Zn-ribbon domain-containing OB-fold protein [Maritimibacter alkaliphilus]|uniref:Zn-ribbon domain-containing OB-fold protein n=1 Tax=Maritimibacter alkaliphilus TaxID=404236 RepID=UPI001C97A9AF|nr:OB-fold domain-containing protein [Maritimibacter alkaliphilus]MBY6092350.1 OB-fold domain-containing protein [Maritimibacter alkaliphilus]